LQVPDVGVCTSEMYEIAERCKELVGVVVGQIR
jgi:hypothetical protein